MAKWKCKLSGNIVEFHNEHDDAGMEGHAGYEKVVEQVEDKEEPIKRVGRPPKVKEEA